MKCLKISISTNVVSTKWYHLGINAIFLQQKPGFIFLNEDVPVKKAEITAEGDFSQPSSKRHSFAEVFLVSLIIY